MASVVDSLLAPVRDAAGRAGVTEFLRWWQGELAALVPPAWRERLSQGGVAYVASRDGEWRILRVSQGALVETGRVSPGAPDLAARRATFRRLVQEVAGAAAPNVWLVLGPEEILLRTVTLPLAAEEALRDTLGFELDRLTPFSAEHACVDFRVTGRDVTAQRLTLELAVAARAPVASRLAELRELGATVVGVGVAGDLAASSPALNLLPPEERDRPATSPSQVATRVLAALAAVLAIAALAYPLWQKREAVIALQPRLEKAKASADVAERLAAEIERLAAEHNFLLGKKQGQYPAVVLLEDLSRILPDTTWIQQLDIKTTPKLRELQLAGETGSSSQLIEVLEKSGSLANASFKSPLTKGVSPGTERFLVAAEVKPRALPEPIPEAALISAPGAAATPGAAQAPASPPATAPAAGGQPASATPVPAGGTVVPAPAGSAPGSPPAAPGQAKATPSPTAPAAPVPSAPSAAPPRTPAPAGAATPPAKG